MFSLPVAVYLITIAEHLWITLSTSNKTFANLSKHNLYFFSDERHIELNGFKIFPDFPKKITFPGSSKFHDITRFSRFPDRVSTPKEQFKKYK